MTLKRRLARLEELMCPGEVTLENMVLATCSTEYFEWLQDEVEAGRLRHGKLVRLILEAAGHSAAEIDKLIAMNRTGRDPKPARPAPRVEAWAPAGYRVDASSEPPAVPTKPVPAPTAAPIPDPEPVEVEPARIVKFLGAPIRDEMTYNPMDLEPE